MKHIILLILTAVTLCAAPAVAHEPQSMKLGSSGDDAEGFYTQAAFWHALHNRNKRAISTLVDVFPKLPTLFIELTDNDSIGKKELDVFIPELRD